MLWSGDAVLVPELSIGVVEGPAELMFGQVSSIEVDAEGRIFVLDGLAREVRVFDSTGVHMTTLGRPGEGPGELRSAGSLALLPGGRIAVHDPAARRIVVYAPGESDAEMWGYDTGGHAAYPSDVLRADRAGRLFISAPYDAPGVLDEDRILVIEGGGVIADTLHPPGVEYEPPSVELQLMPEVSDWVVSRPIPFASEHYWSLDSDGRFVTGISTEYRIDARREHGILRIERAHDPVAVTDAERERHTRSMTEAMRFTDPGWRWNGPPIPAEKPPFRGLHAGRNGRIWVRLWTESPPENGEAPARYDVFEADGTYLGAVAAPEGFSDEFRWGWAGNPRPTFDGDGVWAATRDELGIQRVVRFRLQVPGR